MKTKYWNTHEPEEGDFPVITAGGRWVRAKWLINMYTCEYCINYPEVKLCTGCLKTDERIERIMRTKYKRVGWLPAREIAATIKYRPESEDER